MADSFTANYNLTKVEVGSSANTWGGKLNSNFDTIDTQLKSVSNTATAAMPKAGGTFTGAVTLAADPSVALGAATKQYVDAAVSGGVGGVASVPAGTILPYGGASAPAGYLACDGAAVSRTTYATLFGIIGTAFGAGNGTTTFNVPELRGEFLRGWDNGRGVDGSRARGSTQAADIAPHTHTASLSVTGTTNTTGAHTHTVSDASGINSGSWPKASSSTAAGAQPSTGSAGDHSHTVTGTASGTTGSTGTTETRPRNVAVNFIIKT